MAEKPNGFKAFDSLMRKLVKVKPEELDDDKAKCRRCGHTYAEHDRANKYTVEACAADGCDCSQFKPAEP